MRFDYVWLTWERETVSQLINYHYVQHPLFIVTYAVKNELLYLSEGSLELKTSNMLFNCSCSWSLFNQAWNTMQYVFFWCWIVGPFLFFFCIYSETGNNQKLSPQDHPRGLFLFCFVANTSLFPCRKSHNKQSVRQLHISISPVSHTLTRRLSVWNLESSLYITCFKKKPIHSSVKGYLFTPPAHTWNLKKLTKVLELRVLWWFLSLTQSTSTLKIPWRFCKQIWIQQDPSGYSSLD